MLATYAAIWSFCFNITVDKFVLLTDETLQTFLMLPSSVTPLADIICATT